jgi:MFS transporter, DHA3 family, macrolide efflux protein
MIKQGIAGTGIRTFAVLCVGQLVSLIGSGLSGFALSVWVYQRTQSITQFGLVIFCSLLPNVLISPIAGVFVDRFDRRRVMIFSDVGLSLITLILALLLMADRLQVWQVCICLAICSMISAFRVLAFTVSLSLLVPKQHFGRALGVLQFSESTSMIIAPILAGVLVGILAIHKVLLIDFATFIFSLVLLLNIVIPRPQEADKSETQSRSLLSEFTFGWRYIRMRPGLLALLLLYACVNVNTATAQMLIQPLVLRLASPAALATVLSFGAAGVLAGSVAMSIWGGPKSRVKAVLRFNLMQSACLILAGLYLNIPVITAALFLISASFPIINNCSQAVWQTKVAPDVQGRVFATRRMIAMIFVPIAYLGAGPLADQIFEPLMDVNGPLASNIGWLVGTGPNKGIGLLFILLGVAMVLEVVAGYWYPRLRRVEQELPDAIPSEPPVQAEKTAHEVIIPPPVLESESVVQPIES